MYNQGLAKGKPRGMHLFAHVGLGGPRGCIGVLSICTLQLNIFYVFSHVCQGYAKATLESASELP